ncbi:hypothetical protein MKY20_28515 [Cytobacillus sp. FSL W8-0315]|uniref:hypothetical protein n=1 Tax=Cytobacillus sp. FSL W8-0315 TaxID=2921600 RepID=UPI0030F63D93
MKKWHLIAMTALTLVAAPNLKAEAASIGSDTIYVGHDMWASGSYTKNIHAKAGKVRICAYGDTSGSTTRVHLEERDEAGNAPEFIAQKSSHNFYNSCWEVSIPSSLVDGTNARAELRLYAERTDSFQKGRNVDFSFNQ